MLLLAGGMLDQASEAAQGFRSDPLTAGRTGELQPQGCHGVDAKLLDACIPANG
jgi:hypothetical protein